MSTTSIVNNVETIIVNEDNSSPTSVADRNVFDATVPDESSMEVEDEDDPDMPDLISYDEEDSTTLEPTVDNLVQSIVEDINKMTLDDVIEGGEKVEESQMKISTPPDLEFLNDMDVADEPTEISFPKPDNEVDDGLTADIKNELDVSSPVEEKTDDDFPEVLVIRDGIFAGNTLANCDWGYNSKPFYDVNMSTAFRRQKRTPLTSQTDMYCLYRFLMTLLETAMNMEFDLPEDSEMKYYVFKPYNSSLLLSFDKFSLLSSKREIGIKTKLNKEAANVILSIYYVLFMRFKLTSDEIIFEDLYRECVLGQDSNFDLAQFNKRITEPENLVYFQAMRSMMQECLSLVPMPFEQRVLQFNAWTICYSNQTTQVKSKSPDRFDKFMSPIDLMSAYDITWYRNLPNPNPLVGAAMDVTGSSTKNSSTETTETNNKIAVPCSQMGHTGELISNDESCETDVASTPVKGPPTDEYRIDSVNGTPLKKSTGPIDTVGKLIGMFVGMFTPAKTVGKKKTC